MIAITNKQEPDHSLHLSKEGWAALSIICHERQKTPEEMVETWIARYIRAKEQIAQEEQSQKEAAKE